MTTEKSNSATLIETIEQSLLKAGKYHKGNEAPPAAILWTDADGQWQPVVDQLRERMPQLLTYGEYDPALRVGPAIWLKCVIEPGVRKQYFPQLEVSAGQVPVIYLPQVSRQTLRAVEECPDALKPFVELQYRGAVWAQSNGKDWTVRAFLMSEDGGLGLDVADDSHTREAMHGSLKRLTTTPVTELQGKRLEADDFNQLMTGDPIRNLLQWLSDPEGTRGRWGTEEWGAFCNICKDSFALDLATDVDIDGAEKLAGCQGPWKKVWERYIEAPTVYPGIPDLLRRAKGDNLFPEHPEFWPDENDKAEVNLKEKLLELGSVDPTEARKRLAKLEDEHGFRRNWVWARLELSSLAMALEHLAALAKQTITEFGGASPAEMAKLYVEGRFLADDAVLRALACVKRDEDCQAVTAAIRSVYEQWLNNSARHLQDLLKQSGYPSLGQFPVVEAKPGECLLFVDGLRYDLGQRLVALAEAKQLTVSGGWRWAAIPTVTATAKPAISPIASKLTGDKLGDTYSPIIAGENKQLTHDKFHKLLTQAGYQIIVKDQPGLPDATDTRGWSEYGEFDKLGHDLNIKMAAQVQGQLDLLVERIATLLQLGWDSVRIVTDHGWLLMPGGLPTTSLPKYLTESKWSRCATIKGQANVELPYEAWSWNPEEHVAYATGASSFISGRDYAHGGISLQECCVPDMSITAAPGSKTVSVTIEETRWTGLWYRVKIKPTAVSLSADLRTKPADPGSSVSGIKAIDSDGSVGLMVADDSLEGATASLVILDSTGKVISKNATTIGADD